MIKKFLRAADMYIQRLNWKDFFLVKVCLCSMGVLIGLCVSKEKKRPVFVLALCAFIATYIPLMKKFFPLLCSVTGTRPLVKTE